MALETTVRIGGDATGALSAFQKVEKGMQGMFRGERAVERQAHGLFESLGKAKSWDEAGRAGASHLLRALNIGLAPAVGVMAGLAVYEGLSESATDANKIFENLQKASSVRFDQISQSFESANKFSEEFSKNLEDQKKKIEEDSQGFKGFLGWMLGLKKDEENALESSQALGSQTYQLAAHTGLEKEIKLQENKLAGREKEIELDKIDEKLKSDISKLQEASRHGAAKDIELANKNLDLLKKEADLEKQNVNKKYGDKERSELSGLNRERIDARTKSELSAPNLSEFDKVGIKERSEISKVMSSFDEIFSKDLTPRVREFYQNLENEQLKAIQDGARQQTREIGIKNTEYMNSHQGGVSSLATIGGGGRTAMMSIQQKANDLLEQIVKNTSIQFGPSAVYQ